MTDFLPQGIKNYFKLISEIRWEWERYLCRACQLYVDVHNSTDYYAWFIQKDSYYIHMKCYTLRWRIFLYTKQFNSGYLPIDKFSRILSYYQDIESFKNYEKTTLNKL